MTLDDPHAVAWIEIDRNSLIRDLELDRITIGEGASLLAVVKANAYGRGLASLRAADVVGIALHFAKIEDTIALEFTGIQLQRIYRALDVVRRGLSELPPHIQVSFSAATLIFYEADFKVAASAISMVGHWPSQETRSLWAIERQDNGGNLQIGLTWTALVGLLDPVASDESMGIGGTWRARRPRQLAVIPAGYANGYSRTLGNRGRVLIRGRSAFVVWRLGMDILMADATDIPNISIGDEVVLTGGREDDEVPVNELASLTDTINYEFLARCSPAISRAEA